MAWLSGELLSTRHAELAVGTRGGQKMFVCYLAWTVLPQALKNVLRFKSSGHELLYLLLRQMPFPIPRLLGYLSVQ